MSTKLPEGKLRSYEAIALTPSRAVTIPTMDLRSMIAELFEHRAERDRRRRNAQPYDPSGTTPLGDDEPNLPPSIDAWKPGQYQIATFVRLPGGSVESSIGQNVTQEEAAALIALRDKAFTTEIQSAAKASTEAAEARMDAAMQRQGRELIVGDERKERP
jgi:hypothetical protein